MDDRPAQVWAQLAALVQSRGFALVPDAGPLPFDGDATLLYDVQAQRWERTK